ncbi:hypothetical protein OH77DRAFT_183465 [Trametes cingulata]|nr:hypothetical protein OH77DRAFT_183465 [Trametes cingulata]
MFIRRYYSHTLLCHTSFASPLLGYSSSFFIVAVILRILRPRTCTFVSYNVTHACLSIPPYGRVIHSCTRLPPARCMPQTYICWLTSNVHERSTAIMQSRKHTSPLCCVAQLLLASTLAASKASSVRMQGLTESAR